MQIHHNFASFFKKEEQQSIQPYAYAVSKQLAQGSICLDLEEREEGDKLKAFEGFKGDYFVTPDLKSALKEVSGVANLVGNENDLKKPFVLHKDNFYITRYFKYETQILEGIKGLIQSAVGKRADRFKWLKSSKGFQKLLEGQTIKEGADWQLVAAVMAFVNNFSIITGGPGTGKTTTVAKILNLLYEENPALNVKLAAPTGKAAMRMKEALAGNDQIPEAYKGQITSLNPFTLHRMLGPKHQSPYFKHNADNKLDPGVIIVDEASMIDVALFSKLIAAIGPDTRLIILGDQNQLASVEAGSLLGDLCATVPQKNHFSEEVRPAITDLVPGFDLPKHSRDILLRDHITELKHSWRFDEHPEFREVSQAVISNDSEKIKSWFEEDGLKGNITIDPDYDEILFQRFVRDYEEYIEQDNKKLPTHNEIAASIKRFNELRILAVIRNGKNGVAGLNLRVENYLVGKGLINSKSEFYEFRPVIVTRNHPDLQLFNGDVGIVRRDPDNPKKMKIWFLAEEQKAGQEVESNSEGNYQPVRGYSTGLLTDVETVFAMTVHKSQGSEFEKLLLVMPKVKDLPLLTRELLYTGITRAKAELLIQGTEEVILKAADGQVKRASGINNRI